MELREFVKMALDRVKQGTDRATKDLTPAELKWQPDPNGNSIGFLLYHIARTEDRFVNTNILGQPTVWLAGKWAQKMGIPETDSGGFGYTAEKVAAFPVPPLADLQAYAEAVRKKTNEALNDLTADKTDKLVQVGGPFGEVPLGTLWAIIYSNITQHIGEISFIRGMMRGCNK